jgi:hypothetical protein
METFKIYKKRMLIMIITALVFTGMFSAGLFRFFPTYAHELGHCIFGGGGIVGSVELDGSQGYASSLDLFGQTATKAGGVLGAILVASLFFLLRQGFWKGFGLAIILYTIIRAGSRNIDTRWGDYSYPGVAEFVAAGLPVMIILSMVIFAVGIWLNIKSEKKMKAAGKKTLSQKIAEHNAKKQKKATAEIMEYAKMY